MNTMIFLYSFIGYIITINQKEKSYESKRVGANGTPSPMRGITIHQRDGTNKIKYIVILTKKSQD